MARRVNLLQSNFSSGELGPEVLGRVDLQRYTNGCRTMVNWLPMVQGGARRASGTRFIAQLVRKTRLEPYEAGLTARFLLAFSDTRLDIYTEAGALHQSIVGCPWTEAQLFDLDLAQALDTVVITHTSWAPRRITRSGLSVFTLDLAPLVNIPDYGGTDIWTDARGWPRCVCFYQSRLVLGGSTSYPNRMVLSKAGGFFDFAVGSLADDAIDIELLSDTFDQINWVFGGRHLTVGTTSGEWAAIQSTPLTPELATFTKQTGIGSSRMKPTMVDGSILHCTRTGDQLREWVYADTELAYTSKSLSLLNPRAVESALQLSSKTARGYDDANLVLIACEDHLAILNVLRDQEFVAWMRRTFQGNPESVACIGENIYLVVSFAFGPGVYADGVYEPDTYEGDGANSNRLLVLWDDALTLDYAKTVSAGGSPISTFTGYGHLAGNVVKCILDGVLCGEVTVADDGSITINGAGLSLTAGVALPVPTLEPMPAAFEGVTGSTALALKRLIRSTIKMTDTQGLEVNGDMIDFRTAEDDVLGDPSPFTGSKIVRGIGWDRDALITITATEAYPATLQSVVREIGY